MDIDYFLLKDKIQDIQTKFLLKNGWLKIYESSHEDHNDSAGIYCCLVSNDYLSNFTENYHWPIHIGSEGKPSVFGDNSYKTYAEEGLEPFIFSRSFSLQQNPVRYIDISEEFVLYFNLYETGSDKQNRKFLYIDDYGEQDEVMIIEPNLIKIKIKYLKEYITIRDMHFVICFDYMRLVKKVPSDWELNFGESNISEAGINYNHLIRNLGGTTQSWILGKVLIEPNSIKKTHFDLDKSKCEEFIIGYDENGELIFEKCDAEENHFTLTFFKKEVLDKYYNNPESYDVESMSVNSKFFHLKIDNNVRTYVPVFLRDLRILPHKEQLHWKQYNIAPEEGMGISRTYYTTMIEGNWAENSEAVDLFFKEKFTEFNEKWKAKFGYYFYKPLSKKDEYIFKSLHSISSNNIKSFCEQTLTIVKLTIDRINENEISKGLEFPPNTKGITKLEKFIESNEMKIPQMFEFLRHLQNLRSGLIAHSFSETNKECKKALEYFEVDKKEYTEILDDILEKSIFTLNTLSKKFEL
ncbi:hypothetical protein FNO01nite_34740 [Flavobacterium noncentrifugens]|uniref:Uncharacterized protein n=1 Tax=Flavobacterium noncentrifugens TaxID=1128970 RepID=A0A1G8UTM8_9FLAO|nr:hypothetical protein [Flavobacterium noncentrifugens]GEP52802.1 hypothetical protein FNO01nite_34740 [Flavobacterium noncentrifugens]SDJ57141.1 hypothetical protein SAMN04487935_1041 [Flavobacterium noncentrifugens]